MPRIEAIIEAVGQAGFISTLDLTKRYYQVPVVKENQQKTAFTSHAGHFQFMRMPFGVLNAPAVFQFLMDKVLKDVKEFSHAYMDDIVIFSSSWEDHVRYVRDVLELLRKAGLTANPAKCNWGRSRVKFLATSLGVAPLPFLKIVLKPLVPM